MLIAFNASLDKCLSKICRINDLQGPVQVFWDKEKFEKQL